MRALLTGISGQDGYYMAKLLLNKGVEVIALMRNLRSAEFACADFGHGMTFLEFDFYQANGVAEVIENTKPVYIFNFAAKSTGSGMFDDPRDMQRINSGFPMDILHAMIASDRREELRFVQASSSEMYGSNDAMPQNETSAFRPISPYGAAKLYVHNMIGIYRASYGLHASSAILFNHESPRRGQGFVTRKITKAAARIAAGLQDKLQLGNVSSRRDWGYAPEYVAGVLRMAESPEADDYVLATGTMHGLTDVLEIAFGAVGLSYTDYLEVDPALSRSVDSKGHLGDASKIAAALGWSAKTKLSEIIVEMVEAELNEIAHEECSRWRRTNEFSTEGQARLTSK
jgi:GDPmannose 4,6-dehydratase